MKPHYPIAGLVHHRPATIPAAEARAQLLVVALVIGTFALLVVAALVGASAK